jgi:hypothetical protein
MSERMTKKRREENRRAWQEWHAAQARRWEALLAAYIQRHREEERRYANMSV